MGAPPIWVCIYRNGIHVCHGNPAWIPNASWAKALKIFANTESTIEEKNRKLCSSLLDRLMKEKKIGQPEVDEAIGGVTKSVWAFDSVDVSFEKSEEDYFDPKSEK